MLLLRLRIRPFWKGQLFRLNHDLYPSGMLWVFLVGGRLIIFTIILPDLKIIIFLNVRIKPVLDPILWPSRQKFANLAPLRPHPTKKLNYFHVFLLRPLLATDVWVQLVNKPLADLLSRLCTQLLSYQAPVVAHLLYHLQNDLILIGAPDFLALAQAANSSESVETLILVPVLHFFWYDLPFLWMHLIQRHQPFVFLCGPSFDQTLFSRWCFDSNFEKFWLLRRATQGNQAMIHNFFYQFL